jgi:hypothetical protein
VLRFALRMALLYELLYFERASWTEIPFNGANFRMALSSRNSGQFALSDSWEGLLQLMHLVAQRKSGA